MNKRQLSFAILHQAYKLALGLSTERQAALDELAHLIFVLQHYDVQPTTTTKEEKSCH